MIHCGGAPLDEKYVQFFDDIGIGLYFGYGISECSPVLACNTPDDRKAGSVGKLIPSEYVTVKIENGEILVKGKIVSCGYIHFFLAPASFCCEGSAMKRLSVL